MIEQSRVQEALDRTSELYSYAHEKCAHPRTQNPAAIKQYCEHVYSQTHAAVEKIWAEAGLTMKRTPRDETGARVVAPTESGWGKMYHGRGKGQNEMNEPPFASYENLSAGSSSGGWGTPKHAQYDSRSKGRHEMNALPFANSEANAGETGSPAPEDDASNA